MQELELAAHHHHQQQQQPGTATAAASSLPLRWSLAYPEPAGPVAAVGEVAAADNTVTSVHRLASWLNSGQAVSADSSLPASSPVRTSETTSALSNPSLGTSNRVDADPADTHTTVSLITPTDTVAASSTSLNTVLSENAAAGGSVPDQAALAVQPYGERSAMIIAPPAPELPVGITPENRWQLIEVPV